MKADPPNDHYQHGYLSHYKELNTEKGLASWVLKRSHIYAEDMLPDNFTCRSVLEIGTGALPHINFVKHSYERYDLSDILPLSLEELTLRDNVDQKKINILKEDATKLSLPDNAYGRVIASHVLEHLPEPHAVLREWHRVLEPGGILTLILPCDPGIAWRVGRMFGPRRRAKAMGMEYDYWMAREHINPITNLLSFINYYFPDRKSAWWPWRRLASVDLNLIFVCHISKER